MKKEHDHETLADKFWGWWDYADLGEIVIGILLFLVAAFVVTGIAALITVMANLRTSEEEAPPPDEPAAHMARAMPDAAEVGGYLSAVCIAEEYHSIAEYTEGDGPAPEWWNPGEPMAAEWVASCQQVKEPNNEAGFDDLATYKLATKQVNQQVNPIPTQTDALQRTDAGCPDWNVDSTLYGWDGRTMEAWEMDVFSRVMYLEFWGTSPECCEAGCDAILRLWESGYYGDTMYGVLSAETEVGGPVFETWDAVWGTEYDPDGLWEMRSLCEERFQSGPEWIAPFFRTGHYHEWAVPAYEIDGVYFSTGKGWE